MNIKKGDIVIVLSGKDKGKEGKVLHADPKEGKVIVEGVNVAMKHKKPRKQGDEGGIIKMETPNLHLQGYACLPQVQQAHQSRIPLHRRRKQSPRLQEVRRDYMREDRLKWQD